METNLDDLNGSRLRRQAKVDDIFELNIGDATHVNLSQVYEEYDGPIVYLDGELMLGTPGVNHADLIFEALGADPDPEGVDDEAAFEATQLLNVHLGKLPGSEVPDHSLATGYAMGDVALMLRASFVNTSEIEVINELQDAGFAEVLTLDESFTNAEARRVANVNFESPMIDDRVTIDEPLQTLRNQPFLYFDGEVIVGEQLDKHSGLVDELGNAVDDNYAFAAGHLINDVAVVDELTCFGCSLADVVDAVLDQLPVTRVFVVGGDAHELTRVACLVRQTRRRLTRCQSTPGVQQVRLTMIRNVDLAALRLAMHVDALEVTD